MGLSSEKDSGNGHAIKKWSQIDWIENGGELWEESVLPYYTVAKIETPAHLNKIMSSCKYRYIYVEEKNRAKRMGEINN